MGKTLSSSFISSHKYIVHAPWRLLSRLTCSLQVWYQCIYQALILTLFPLKPCFLFEKLPGHKILESARPGFHPWLYCSFAVWPWTSCLIIPSLRFFSSTTGNKKLPEWLCCHPVVILNKIIYVNHLACCQAYCNEVWLFGSYVYISQH